MTARNDASGDPLARLAAVPVGEPVVLLHSCGEGPSDLFLDAVDILALDADPKSVRGAFERVDEFLLRHRDRFCSGFLGYDLRDAVEPIPRTIRDDFPQPSLWIAAFARCDRFDGSVPPSMPPEIHGATLRPAALPRSDYEAAVRRVVEHIRAGDLFQANFTQPFDVDLGDDVDPRAIFARLCAVSPAPYAAFVGTGGDLDVMSSSPEEFLCADGASVRTRPIKGTRPRDADGVRDASLLGELLDSEKDLAELAMIVDLLRNDLGKVAEVGSVTVGPFPEHASFAQVHHLFATVRAKLRAGTSTGELLRATFPGGSITGAPKLRSMELLEAIEVCRRGVYCGAIGELAASCSVRLNIAIRTMVRRGRRVRFHAGGGITADSIPEAEYAESLHKAAGMLRALGVASADTRRGDRR